MGLPELRYNSAFSLINQHWIYGKPQLLDRAVVNQRHNIYILYS